MPNGIVGTYGFDDADQLLSIVYTRGMTLVGDVSYTYDLAGRRVGQSGSLAKLTMPSTVTSTSYDAANRLHTWGSNSLSYDDNGNLTLFGSTTFNWNVRDELVATSGGSSTFAYDAFGRRTSRTVGGSTTGYLHDGMNPVTVNDDLMLTGLGLDQFFARVSSSGSTSFVTDDLGTVRLLTDENGNATASYGYTLYGTTSKSGPDDTPFQFTGRENDGESNLYYYRARYYSAELGRFVQSDPIGLQAGVNTYAYVNGAPTMATDPLGLTYRPWWQFGHGGVINPFGAHIGGYIYDLPDGSTDASVGEPPAGADIDFIYINCTWYKIKHGYGMLIPDPRHPERVIILATDWWFFYPANDQPWPWRNPEVPVDYVNSPRFDNKGLPGRPVSHVPKCSPTCED